MYHKIYQDQRKNAVHIYFIRYLETFSKLKKEYKTVNSSRKNIGIDITKRLPLER